MALNGDGWVVMDFPSLFRVSCLKLTKRVLNGGSEDLSDDSNEPPEIYKQKRSYQAVERGTVYLSMLKYTVPLF